MEKPRTTISAKAVSISIAVDGKDQYIAYTSIVTDDEFHDLVYLVDEAASKFINTQYDKA